MTTYAKIGNAIYWLALSTWFAVLLMTAVTAGFAFTYLPGLDIELADYAAFSADPAVHGRIAAGILLEPIFFVSDIVQIVTGIVALGMLLLQMTAFGMPLSRGSNTLRGLCILIAGGLLIFRLVTVMPDMNRDLMLYREAARDAAIDQAQAHKASFDRAHVRAERLYGLTFLFIALVVVSSAVAFTPHRDRAREELEQPELSRRP